MQTLKFGFTGRFLLASVVTGSISYRVFSMQSLIFMLLDPTEKKTWQRDPFTANGLHQTPCLRGVLNVKENCSVKSVPVKDVYSPKELAEPRALMSVPQEPTI